MATVISEGTGTKTTGVRGKKSFDPKVWLSQLRPVQLVTHIILLVLGFFYIFPFLWMMAGSLKSLSGFFSEGLSLIPNDWRWQNYIEIPYLSPSAWLF
jgi:ABC-type glycerol-3-phosphate transport system permease component